MPSTTPRTEGQLASPATHEADYVVAGAGHNGLITACYLAKAGFSVIVIESTETVGGGAKTEEPLLPGYHVDMCSTGHTLIQANPLMTRDELGLRRDFDLDYVVPDPVAHVRFPDGTHFTHYLDLDATLDEIRRFSHKDAEAYRRMLTEWDEVKAIFGGANFRPVGSGPSVPELLSRLPSGPVWERRRMLSAWEVIRHEFEDRHIQSYMLWQAYQTGIRPDQAGTGLQAYSTVCARQRTSWTIPRGGSGRLTDALVASLESNGGRVAVNQHVESLIMEDGRCVGARTTQGHEFRGSQGLVSSIHVKHLLDMAPAEAWDEAWRYGVQTYEIGTSAFGVYLLTDRAPEFEVGDGRISAVSAGYVGWPDDLLRMARDLSEGIWREDVQWLLVATPSLADPGRVPVAGHQTVKLLGPAGWKVPDGDNWDDMKTRLSQAWLNTVRRWCPEFTEDAVLASMVKGPYDYEATNPHMIRGALHGGDRTPAFSGPMRPAPGWARHETPIAGLYQTGGTTHPGGSITGAPGRNAATIILAGHGIDIDEMNVLVPAVQR